MSKSNDTCHPCHKKQLSRLNRLAGQIEGVRRMIDEERYCPEILTQLRAVRAAVKSLEAEILKGHLSSCVINALSSSSKKEREEQIEELTGIFQRFS